MVIYTLPTWRSSTYGLFRNHCQNANILVLGFIYKPYHFCVLFNHQIHISVGIPCHKLLRVTLGYILGTTLLNLIKCRIYICYKKLFHILWTTWCFPVSTNILEAIWMYACLHDNKWNICLLFEKTSCWNMYVILLPSFLFSTTVFYHSPVFLILCPLWNADVEMWCSHHCLCTIAYLWNTVLNSTTVSYRIWFTHFTHKCNSTPRVIQYHSDWKR